ncbi:MAG: DUF2924 domain-containing protein [Magnetococcales bacterium]|nr:DUF2924 domain-containing protein [Magnetococcales bacterium]
MNIGVIRRVAALPGMSVSELKAMWKTYHETEPPPFNRAFLVSRLAYRIQELAYDGLSERNEKRLERIPADDAPQEKKRPPGERLMTGTRLTREWKGVQHSCVVLDDGFEYQGRRFKSLSAVANFITGSKWNGLVFFGLKKQEILK